MIDTERPFGKSFSHDFVRVDRPVLEIAKKVAGFPKLWNPQPFGVSLYKYLTACERNILFMSKYELVLAVFWARGNQRTRPLKR